MPFLVGLIRLLSRLLVWALRAVWWCVVRLYRLWRRSRSARGWRGSHGSSRWASYWQQVRGGALKGNGIVLGRGAFGRLLRFSRDGLVMVFAATGAGKGLGVVIPTLLTYPGSMVVTDPKGENYAITRRRREAFGRVLMLNPTDLLSSARFNPMDIIRIGTVQEADDAAALAALVLKADAREAHWDDKATSILKALILHALHDPYLMPNLAAVRRLSVGARETFIATLEDIVRDSPSPVAREIASGFLASSVDPDGRFTPEFASILSNLQKATEPWSEGAPAGILSAYSTFQLADLSSEVITLYLCVDEDVLVVYERWLRVVVGCVLKGLTRAKSAPPHHKVVLLLDEVAVLGRLDTLESQSGLLRAYCTPVLIWQNLPQVQRVYGQAAEAFLANASARVFFGVNDHATAHYAATLIGQATVRAQSRGTSQSGNTAHHTHQQGEAEGGYWLMDAAEIQRLPPTRVIMKLRDVPQVIRGKRLDYRHMWRWRGLWDRWQASPPTVSLFPQALVTVRESPLQLPEPPRAPALTLRETCKIEQAATGETNVR